MSQLIRINTEFENRSNTKISKKTKSPSNRLIARIPAVKAWPLRHLPRAATPITKLEDQYLQALKTIDLPSEKLALKLCEC